MTGALAAAGGDRCRRRDGGVAGWWRGSTSCRQSGGGRPTVRVERAALNHPAVVVSPAVARVARRRPCRPTVSVEPVARCRPTVKSRTCRPRRPRRSAVARCRLSSPLSPVVARLSESNLSPSTHANGRAVTRGQPFGQTRRPPPVDSPPWTARRGPGAEVESSLATEWNRGQLEVESGSGVLDRAPLGCHSGSTLVEHDYLHLSTGRTTSTRGQRCHPLRKSCHSGSTFGRLPPPVDRSNYPHPGSTSRPATHGKGGVYLIAAGQRLLHLHVRARRGGRVPTPQKWNNVGQPE
jgi:hypothetical protein